MFYKFLDKRYVEGTRRGRLKFGRLKYYRELEIKMADRWIGDRNEGRATTMINATLKDANPADAAALKSLDYAGIAHLSGGSTIIFENFTCYSEVDCFVFCFSSGNLEELVASMCSPERAKYAYDGCIRLEEDHRRILDLIGDFGTVDGKTIAELFREIYIGEVLYDARVHQFDGSPIVRADPFKKFDFYKMQREWRIVLIPNTIIDLDYIFVDCDRLSDLMIEEVIEIPPLTRGGS